jgi:Tol biopolymer transport system component
VDPVTEVRDLGVDQRHERFRQPLFSFSNFTADNRYLIFVSDRTGSRLLFRAEVETGRITQLTGDSAMSASSACPDPTTARRIFCLRGSEVLSLDILDFTTRKIGEIRNRVPAVWATHAQW